MSAIFHFSDGTCINLNNVSVVSPIENDMYKIYLPGRVLKVVNKHFPFGCKQNPTELPMLERDTFIRAWEDRS